jgi:hypothetical protein
MRDAARLFAPQFGFRGGKRRVQHLGDVARAGDLPWPAQRGNRLQFESFSAVSAFTPATEPLARGRNEAML